MATTTIETDTELSAVNSILGAIGQAPITQLKDPTTGVISNNNPEIQFIYNLLRDANVDVQSEGWHFNRERHVTFSKDTTTNKIAISNDIVKIDLPDNWSRRHYNFVRRGGYLYDKITHTDTFTDMGTTIELDVIRIYNYEDLPPVFKRYITYRASRMAATQLVANPQLVQLLGTQEALSRASLLEYECNQGEFTFFGHGKDGNKYTSFKPFHALQR